MVCSLFALVLHSLLTDHPGRVAGLNWHVIMNDSCHSNDDDMTLFVSWIFGEARWFSKCVSRIAYKATIDKDGNLLNARGQRWDKSGLPAQILGEKPHRYLQSPA